jgi:hypothetical protein
MIDNIPILITIGVILIVIVFILSYKLYKGMIESERREQK